jgi:hypothetical protein
MALGNCLNFLQEKSVLLFPRVLRASLRVHCGLLGAQGHKENTKNADNNFKQLLRHQDYIIDFL